MFWELLECINNQTSVAQQMALLMFVPPPLHFMISALGSLRVLHNTQDQRLYVPSEGRRIMIKYLA